MKKYLLLLLSLTLVIFSCSDSDDPISVVEDAKITLNDTKLELPNEGGVKSILFETKKNWTAKSDASWCTLSPTSGDASVKSINVTLSANDTYDDRDCMITISADGLSKSITVTQGENLGLLITQDRYELSNEEGTIKVEVKANVEFEVEINDEWITELETRALTTSEIEFKIEENDTYGNREGSITIKQKDGELSSTITIF